MKAQISILLILIANSCFGQISEQEFWERISEEPTTTIFINEKSYNATREFKFEFKNDEENLYATIGKDGEKGIVFLQFDDSNNEPDYFKTVIIGNIYIYLEDNKVIKCLDRDIRSYVDNISSAVYYLTAEEVKLLKEFNIRSITFTRKENIALSSGNSSNVVIEEGTNTKGAVMSLFKN